MRHFDFPFEEIPTPIVFLQPPQKSPLYCESVQGNDGRGAKITSNRLFFLSMWPFFRQKQTQTSPKDSPSERKTEGIDSFLSLRDSALTDNVYPPPDAPLSALGTDALLLSQSKLIKDLMWAVTMDLQDKDRYLLPIIKNVAAFVHLLPASQSHHHNGRGGLFRHCLETAFYAVNIAKNRLLDVNAHPDDTYHNQSRWFLAIAIAGLLHDVGKCLTDMTVSSPNTESVWLPTVESLSAWLERLQIRHYYCAWNLNRIHRQHECATAVVYALLVPEETRRYLEESHSTKLKNELYEALAGIRREGGEIQAAVDRADAISTKKDLARQLRDGFHPGVNAPIVVFLEKIMQELVEQEVWTVNQVNSPLWVTTHGLFLVWHRAVKAIEERIQSENIPSLPRDSNVWKEKLRESSLVESRFLEDEYNLKIQRTDWRILPYPELKHDCEQHRQQNNEEDAEQEKKNAPFVLNFLTVLKLTDHSLLFSNIGKPAPVPVFIEGESLSEKEKALWMATCHLPTTPFASGEAMNRLGTPAYSDEEVNAIIQASSSKTKSLKDVVLSEFKVDTSPYPDVPLNDVLQTMENRPKPNEETEETKETVEKPTKKTAKLSVEDLLSPSQKAARAQPDVKLHIGDTVHAQNFEEKKTSETDSLTHEDTQTVPHTPPHTDTHTHTHTDNEPKPENKSTQPDEPVKKWTLAEKKAYLTVLLERIKVQLQAGQGDLIEAVLYRDDCIYSSTAPIERDLEAKAISFDSFIDKLHEFQTEPILSLTENRDFVYIERK